jgi:hypothetical protein
MYRCGKAMHVSPCPGIAIGFCPGVHVKHDHSDRAVVILCLDNTAANPVSRGFARDGFRTFCCLSLLKLTVVIEPVEGDFSILADLDEVAVGITHVAAPFPAVII